MRPLFFKYLTVKKSTLVFAAFLSSFVSSQVHAKVIGYIDNFRASHNAVIIKGWACDRTKAGSIDVDVYVGGPAGKGKMIKRARANLSSESAISKYCGNNKFPGREQSVFSFFETVFVPL